MSSTGLTQTNDLTGLPLSLRPPASPFRAPQSPKHREVTAANSVFPSPPPFHLQLFHLQQFCKVHKTAASLVCTQLLWSFTRLSSSPKPNLSFGRSYFPPTNSCSFHLSLIFPALTPKTPALHKAAEIKAIYINARALAFLFQKQSIHSCLKVSLNSPSLLGTRVTGSH